MFNLWSLDSHASLFHSIILVADSKQCEIGKVDGANCDCWLIKVQEIDFLSYYGFQILCSDSSFTKLKEIMKVLIFNVVS